MADETERIVKLEEGYAWLAARVWTGTGNLHDRVHILEDKNGDRVHEIENLQAFRARVERILGLNGYGDKNVVTDLMAAMETIDKIKSGIISRTDFQSVTNDVKDLDKQMTSQTERIDELKTNLDGLKDSMRPLVSFYKVGIWVASVLGVSIIALIWSLITGQAQLVIP